MKIFFRVVCENNITIFKLTNSNICEYSIHHRPLYKEHYKLSYYVRNGQLLRSDNFSSCTYTIESIKKYLLSSLLYRTMCNNCDVYESNKGNFYCKMFVCEKKNFEDFDNNCDKCEKKFSCFTTGRFEEIK